MSERTNARNILLPPYPVIAVPCECILHIGLPQRQQILNS